MTVKIEMKMPKMCGDCPMFEKSLLAEDSFYFMGEPLNGKCKALPIKDYGGRVVNYQIVSTCDEIESHRRSKFCPLHEIKE